MKVAVPSVLFFGIEVTFLVMRIVRRHTAEKDPAGAIEAQSRTQRWGFDPLTVNPGYAPFAWYKSQGAADDADRPMEMAREGYLTRSALSEFLELVASEPRTPHDSNWLR